MKSSNTSSFQQKTQGIYDQINGHFSEQDQQRKTVQEAREVLGESAENLNDQELYGLVTEMHYLVEGWLEEYEKSVFDGKTLKELIDIK